MNTLIYPVEYTAVVKSYSDWVNHENAEILKSIGYRVNHSIVPMRGGVFCRVSVSSKRSYPNDRKISRELVLQMFKDCNAQIQSSCSHKYDAIGDGVFMKAHNTIYEIRRCEMCADSIKFEVGDA
ncbi:hypothetical protein FDI46_gp159 [Aeromonas phage AS-gz]|uniref:Uncharacterized protein n=1 Tax=Aeromonas phage AS-gz TaxID=2026082 RepID=A0A223LF89_9CAUD|nr:hypothetical protein FDI46_gp159 [Aeromonas phage AS-gz]ASU00695.1 hypothetical protein [Aeromonas phage AS-gz]